ncbi:AAA family ATPase [Hydrogenothermus marinus]|uniref:Exonuclease SbcC n=1 Tax=Hydrogenothermus marinus TaxID=133270 RepID=A0A3M0BM70_9AQUI|nr:AAA family ATPase [Hydrogenothermus marinus]RMA97564.1 exonuclease SbcC [Hydrogenothermus marinus]
MILKSINIKNFLAHEDTKINFAEEGITAIVGDNGAGKTSILEAIYFALYGNSSKGKISELVQWGKRQAIVELEFFKGNNQYKIYREITLTGKSHNTLSAVYKKEKGSYRLYYQKNINKEIPKLTGIASKTFTTSILVKQGDIEGLIELKPKERTKVFEELLDMSLYQILSDKYGEKRRNLETQIEAISKTLPDEESLKKEILKLQEKKAELEKEKIKIEKEKADIEEKIKIQNQLVDSLFSKKEEKEKILAKIDKNQENLKILNQQIEEKKEVLKQIEEKEQIIPELEKYVEQLKEKEKIYKAYLQSQKLKEKLSHLKEKQSQLEENLENIKNLEDIAKNYLENKEKLQHLNKKINELSQQKGQIKALEERLQQIKNILKETQNQALEIANQLTKLKRIFNTLKLNPEIAKSMIRDSEFLIEKYQKEREDLLTEHRTLKNKIEEIKQQIRDIENLKGNCPKCLRPVESHSKEEIIKDLIEKEKELEEKIEQIKKHGTEKRRKLEEEKKSLELLKEFQSFYDEHKKAKKEKEDINIKIKLIERRLKKLEDLEKQKEEIEKFLKENEENYQTYIQSKKVVKQLSNESIENNIRQIESQLKDLKIEEIIDIKLLEEEINQLKQKEKEYIKVKGFISQKEKIQRDLEDLENKINTINKNIHILNQKLKEYENIEENLQREKQKLVELETQSKQIHEKLNPIILNLGEVEGKEKVISKEIENLEKNKEELKKLKEKAEKYRKLEISLGPRGIQKIIRDKALKELPLRTEIIFKAFGFNFERIMFSENFDISIQVPTYERKDRFISTEAISGGQKVALGLALRLALSHLLGNKSEFLILDEPTIHLDQQRREELVNILLKLKNKKYVKQLIIVTHDREIEDAADQIYYVEEGKVREIA